MIAPIRQTDSPAPDVRHRLDAARRLIASTLLPSWSKERPLPAKTVGRWQAWVFALWMVFVAAVYVAYLMAAR
jgi:4-hydroxybenzoate polyprenyltransferase